MRGLPAPGVARTSIGAALVVIACAMGGAAQDGPPGGGGQRPGAGQRLSARDPRVAEAPTTVGTAILRGQVIAADSGAPVRRAQVRASAQGGRETRLAMTDAQGRFEIRDLTAGRYALTASKGGFVTVQYGQRRVGESGTPLDVADGQLLDRLVVSLPRGSVLAGRITDEFGEPVVNAAVTALRQAFVGGTRRLVRAGNPAATNDLGEYRVFGLPPGDYIVSASVRASEVTDPGEDVSGYAPTYYPGTPNPDEAQRVRLGLQQENGSVSFGLIATRLVSVSGTVLGATGAPAPGGVVILRGAGGGALEAAGFRPANTGRIDGTGAFRIPNVAPGRYQIQARSALRGDGEFARMDLVVGTEDVSGVTLVTAPPGRITGVVVTDSGDALPSSSQRLQVSARPVVAVAMGPRGGGGPNQGWVASDGSFEVGNVTDPLLLRITAPQGWMLKAVLAGSQDVTDVPIDVAPGQVLAGVRLVLTRRVGTVTGTVYDDRRQPVLDATVVIFPVNDAWRGAQSRFVRQARPNQSGVFSLTPLPPGEYLAAAVQGLEDGQASDPEFLASLEDAAARVSLEEGETKTVALPLRPLK